MKMIRLFARTPHTERQEPICRVEWELSLSPTHSFKKIKRTKQLNKQIFSLWKKENEGFAVRNALLLLKEKTLGG